jgi:hypothetical protein
VLGSTAKIKRNNNYKKFAALIALNVALPLFSFSGTPFPYWTFMPFYASFTFPITIFIRSVSQLVIPLLTVPILFVYVWGGGCLFWVLVLQIKTRVL